MSQKNPHITSVFKKEHEGKWVALSGDRKEVIAFSEDLGELIREVKDSNAVYERVLRSDRLYAF